MRHSLFLLPIILLTIFFHAAQCLTINVPGDQPTIQAGIDACVDGDTVLVSDGTYTGDGNRDIDFTGKAIVVMSENGPDVTIIDCDGSEVDPHRGFYFHSGEDSSSVVQGFTITNGYADVSGGGIYNYYSNPTVNDCVFSGNMASILYGGGMANISSNSTVINCTFIGNSASRGGGMQGGGTVSNCTFIGNSAYNGGGMIAGNGTISNCTFSENSASNLGAGIYNEANNPTITNCTIMGNYGQGMVNDLGSDPTVTNCLIIGNTGTGMYNYYSDPTVTNCTFSQNGGFGMYTEEFGSPAITNCIFWGDAPEEIGSSGGGNPTVRYSDVEGGYSGTGNIDVDPLFVSFHGFDYLLRRASPCIDAGNPAIEDGFNWPAWYNNGARSDMGAYGGPGNIGWLR